MNPVLRFAVGFTLFFVGLHLLAGARSRPTAAAAAAVAFAGVLVWGWPWITGRLT